MPYTRTAWVEGGAPGISAANLNKLEAGIAQAHWYGTTTNTGNAYSVTLSPAPASFAELTGVPIRVQCNVNATGALTINVNSLGAKAVKSSFGVATATWKAGSIYTLVYNGTDFILQGEGGSGNATTAQVLAGATYSNDNGPQTGTMPNYTGQNIQGGTPWVSGTTLYFPVNAGGYYPGGGNSGVFATDPDFIPPNIPSDMNFFGLQGTRPLGYNKLANGNIGVPASGAMSISGLGFTPRIVNIEWIALSRYYRAVYMTNTVAPGLNSIAYDDGSGVPNVTSSPISIVAGSGFNATLFTNGQAVTAYWWAYGEI